MQNEGKGFHPIEQTVDPQVARQGISKQRGIEFAQGLMSNLNSDPDRDRDSYENFFRRVAEGAIAGYLQGRYSKQEAQEIMSQFSGEHRKKYYEIVSRHKERLEKQGFIIKPGQGDNYLQVDAPGPHKRRDPVILKDSADKRFFVQFKEYFSFSPTTNNGDRTMVEAERFYKAIEEVFPLLQKVAELYNSTISIKFSSSLEDLIQALDNLVVYVDNPQIGQVIRRLVMIQMEKNRLVLGERKGRGDSGFDFMYGNTEGFSHRQLISKAVASRIYQGIDKILTWTPEKFAYETQKRINQANILTPEQILQVMQE